ncbi:Dbl homology domain-containing protein, partial [Endogone sp. FLAS-F59071]
MSATIGLPPSIWSIKSSRADSGYGGPSYSNRKMSYGTASVAQSHSGSTVTSEDSQSPRSVAFPSVYVSAAQPMQEFVYDDYAEEYAVIDDLYEIYGDEQDNEYIDAEFAFQRRETAIRELYHTEQAYVKGLKLLRDVFFNPLKQQVKQQANRGGFLSGKITCTDAEISLIFGNLEQILDVHDRMLKCLQERLQIWGPTQIVSDIFLHLHPDLKMYNIYLKNYMTAVVTLERLNKTAPFKKFVE